MPRVSGEQVFKEPQVLDPTLRTVLSSGYSEAEIRAQLAGRQPTASRGKPWTPSELLEVFTKMAEPDSQGCEAAKSSSSRARSSTHSSE